MDQHQTESPSITLVLLLFFMSGALALTYEVVWSRMMMNIFGSTAIAVGTVLAAFMTGMAIGSWWIGKLADRSHNCLRLYALLEIGIALAALASHLLLSRIGPAHEAVFALFGSSSASFDLIRFMLAFLLVMVPTILMGGHAAGTDPFPGGQTVESGSQHQHALCNKYFWGSYGCAGYRIFPDRQIRYSRTGLRGGIR